MYEYDVAIIGAGPGGYETAIRCRQYGLSVCLIEERELGGTCLNRGCIPTKALLHCADKYHSANTPSCGVTCGEVKMDYGQMHAYKDAVVRKLRSGVEALERANGVKVMRGRARLRDAHSVMVGGETVTCGSIVLATGSATVMPAIPGIESGRVWTSSDVLTKDTLPERPVIIGAGVIGVEFAAMFSQLGCQTVVLEALDEMLPMLEPEIRQALEASLQANGNVRIQTGAKVVRVWDSDTGVCVRYEQDGAHHTVEGDVCIVAVGRKPYMADLGLENAGVSTERGRIPVNGRMQTNVGNIYAIGDVTGQVQLAHAATAQGMVCAAALAGRELSTEAAAIPSCIYSSPEAAYVGLTEAQARAGGKRVLVGRFFTAGNGRSLIEECAVGLAKIVADDATGEILGAQILAPHAAELIAEITAVMQCEGTIDDLERTVHPHPSISEMWQEAACDAFARSCNAMPKKRTTEKGKG